MTMGRRKGQTAYRGKKKAIMTVVTPQTYAALRADQRRTGRSLGDLIEQVNREGHFRRIQRDTPLVDRPGTFSQPADR